MANKIGTGNRVTQADLDPKQARIGCAVYDNGRTPGSSASNFGSVDFVRFSWPLNSKGLSLHGETLGEGQLIGPAANWTPQFTDNTAQNGKAGTDPTRWVPYFNEVIALLGKSEKTCAAYAVYPAFTWRAVKVTSVDPCFQAGAWSLCRTDRTAAEGNEITVFPVLPEEQVIKAWCREVEVKGEIKIEWYTLNEETEEFEEIEWPTWQPYQGAPPEKIPFDCWIDCREKFDPIIAPDAVSSCNNYDVVFLCAFDGEPLPDLSNQVEELALYQWDCDGERITEIYTLDTYNQSLLPNADPLDPESDQWVPPESAVIANCDGTAAVDPSVQSLCVSRGDYIHTHSQSVYREVSFAMGSAIQTGDGVEQSGVVETEECGDVAWRYTPGESIAPWSGGNRIGFKNSAAVPDSVYEIDVPEGVELKVSMGNVNLGDAEWFDVSGYSSAEINDSHSFDGTRLTGPPGSENDYSTFTWQGGSTARFSSGTTRDAGLTAIARDAMLCFKANQVVGCRCDSDTGETYWEDVKTGERLSDCQITVPPESSLDDFKVNKQTNDGRNYNGAIQSSTGRPLPTVPWALIDNRDTNNQVTVASGNTFPEFVADLASKGYTDFIEGELHYICPCPPGLVNDGDYFVQANGITVTKPACTPLSELPSAPTDKIVENAVQCALQTVGCNDDRRDNLLTQMLEKMCEPCPLQITVDSEGTLMPFDGNLTTLNGTTQTAFDQFGNTLGQVQVAATLQEGEIVKTAIKLTPIAPLETIDSTIATISTKVVAQGGTAK